jgi:pyrroline-5-carboxylate reductase
MNIIKPQITFIGAGNMATALIRGLIANGTEAQQITVSSPTISEEHPLCRQLAVQITQNNTTAAEQADILVFAVKPQRLATVAQALRHVVQQHKPLIISVAAGIRTATLATWLGDDIAIVRSMPNLPARLQAGVSGLYANNSISMAQRTLAETILASVGQTLWVDTENEMDAVTAVSGSGPAYFFLMLEALEEAAQQLGLSATSARLLTLQTAQGAVSMVKQTQQTPAALRAQVSSPGGTTEAAITVFEENHLRDTFKKALTAAYNQSVSLAQ